MQKRELMKVSTMKTNIVANGLSLQNSSGWYVLEGHLESTILNFCNTRLILLVRNDIGNSFIERYKSIVSVHRAPSWTRTLLGRVFYEIFVLPVIVSKYSADCVIQPGGYPAPFVLAKQFVIAQNPYPFVFRNKTSFSIAIKNFVLRVAYLHIPAMNATFFPNSNHMRLFYLKRRESELAGENLFQGVFRSNLNLDMNSALPYHEREKFFLVVAEAADYKRIDLAISAFAIASEDNEDLRLHIVGKMSQPGLKENLFVLAKQLNVSEKIKFLGFISREDLEDQFSRALAYTSFSECESFGIPAVEAQLRGTPVVVSDGTAAAEICGSGACVFSQGSVYEAAQFLTRLAMDPEFWEEKKKCSILNSRKFDWNICSDPLVKAVMSLKTEIKVD